MDAKIVVSDSERKELIEYYKSKVDLINRDLDLLFQKKKTYESMLIKLINVTESHAVDPKVTYDSSWPWSTKIVYVLKKADQQLRTKDIVDVLTNIDSSTDRDRYTSSISAIISQKVDTVFKRFKSEDDKDYYVGLMEWYNDADLRYKYFPDVAPF
jgi:hypothetical protein